MGRIKEHRDKNHVIRFGKYKGYSLKNIPDSYLLYLWGEDGKKLYEDSALKRYIKDNLDAIKANVNHNRYYNKEE